MQKILKNNQDLEKNIDIEKLENLQGNKLIKFISKTLPKKPGIYQMENSHVKQHCHI